MRRIPMLLSMVVLVWTCLGSARAQERSVTVGIPAGPLARLVQSLAPAFQAETGIAVRTATLDSRGGPTLADAQTILLRERLLQRFQTTGQGASRVIFHGDVILVGSHAERARVRGLRDIRTALRWIAAARGTFLSSSPRGSSSSST